MNTIKPIIATIAVTGALTFANATVASSICKKTFTSGAGSTKFEWRFSNDGNIVNLEHPEGLEHVRIGTITEGYCVSAGGSKRGESFGSQANSMLQEAKGAGRKVRHDTADGTLRIEQLFKDTKYRNNKEVSIEITMKVKNLTNGPLTDVFLTRFIDADISNSTGSDVWVSAGRSPSVSEPGSARLDLIPTTKTYPADSLIYASFSPVTDAACYDTVADALQQGTADDRAMGVRYQLGSIDRRRSKTVKFVYHINL